jgi:hypothetical protein
VLSADLGSPVDDHHSGYPKGHGGNDPDQGSHLWAVLLKFNGMNFSLE